MNRGLPQKWGKNVNADPIAFPVFGGDGMPVREGIVFKFKDMKT